MDDLRALGRLINESIDKIEATCAEKNLPIPLLNDPFIPAKHGAFHTNPQVSEAAALIIAASAHLTALVRPPAQSIAFAAVQQSMPAALRVAVESHVPEILREAGPGGLHIQDIAAINNTNADKLGRLMRALATEHIFREVTPNVFAQNRLSSVLDTGKSTAEILARPSEKHLKTNGIGAAVIHWTDQCFKGLAYLAETFFDPAFANSYEPNKTPFSKAYRTDLPFFAWIEQPGNERMLSEFGLAMEGVKNMSPNSVLSGFDWATLPAGSVVVDVGGGIGAQSIVVAKANPNLNIVLQDRESVIGAAQEFWEREHPAGIISKQITFQVHDFMAHQPVKDAAVFFMRFILHDWSDAHCLTILEKLRAAATPQTKLIIVDMLISFACEDTSEATTIPGGMAATAPAPLLANFGHANVLSYMADLQMMNLLGGQERTLAHVSQLLASSGWKLAHVFRTQSAAGIGHQQLLAIPA